MILMHKQLLSRTEHLAGVVILLWLGVAEASGAGPVVLKSHSNLVLVPVTVTDRDGKTLTDLEAKHFEVRDGSETQPIVSFSREDAPASVMVVLDLSGSMIDKLR